MGAKPTVNHPRAVLKLRQMSLVYHKTDLPGGNETAQWHALIKDNCAEYLESFSL